MDVNMQKIKQNVVYMSLIVSIHLCHNSYAHHDAFAVKAAAELNKGLEKVATSINNTKAELPNIGKNSADRVATSVDRAVTVGIGVAVGTGLYVVYREAKKGVCGVKNYFFPNKEEQIHEKEVSKRLNILKAEDELYKSLVEHALEEKNYRGIPRACEAAANKYAAIAGFDALEKILEEFRRAVPRTSW